MGQINNNESFGQIKQVREHHMGMARALVAGLTPQELARAFNFSSGQVTKITSSPVFQAEVARLRKKVEETAVNVGVRLETLNHPAVDRIEQVLRDDNADKRVQINAAFEVLSRTGYGKHDKVSGGETRNNVSATQINLNIGQMTTTELREQVFDLIGEEEK